MDSVGVLSDHVDAEIVGATGLRKAPHATDVSPLLLGVTARERERERIVDLCGFDVVQIDVDLLYILYIGRDLIGMYAFKARKLPQEPVTFAAASENWATTLSRDRLLLWEADHLFFWLSGYDPDFEPDESESNLDMK